MAAITIVIYHFFGAWGEWGGYLAVDFFLVLSGFILSHSYLYKAQPTAPIDFINHRLARLYPLHIFTLLTFIVVYLCIHGGLPTYPDGELFPFIQHLTLTHNTGIPPHELTYNFPSWSISVEFWINILFIFLVSKATRSSTLLIVAVIGLAMIYANTGHLATNIENYYHYINSGIVRGVSSFFLGILSYRIHLRFKDHKHVSKHISVLELLCVISIIMLLFGRDEQWSSIDFFAPFLFMMTVAVFTNGRGILSKHLSKLRYLGTISYSVYLNQLTVLLIIRETVERLPIPASAVLVIYLMILLGYSHLTFQYIENPLRKKGRTFLTNITKRHVKGNAK